MFEKRWGYGCGMGDGVVDDGETVSVCVGVCLCV